MAQTTGTVKALDGVSTPGNMLGLLSQGFEDGVFKDRHLAWHGRAPKADSAKQRLRCALTDACLVLWHWFIASSNLP